MYIRILAFKSDLLFTRINSITAMIDDTSPISFFSNPYQKTTPPRPYGAIPISSRRTEQRPIGALTTTAS